MKLLGWARTETTVASQLPSFFFEQSTGNSHVFHTPRNKIVHRHWSQVGVLPSGSSNEIPTSKVPEIWAYSESIPDTEPTIRASKKRAYFIVKLKESRR
jgi:hypothetical protein